MKKFCYSSIRYQIIEMNIIRFREFVILMYIFLELDFRTASEANLQKTDQTIGYVSSEPVSDEMKLLLENAGMDIYLSLILLQTKDKRKYELADPITYRLSERDFQTYIFKYRYYSNLKAFCPLNENTLTTKYSKTSLSLETEIDSEKKFIRSSKFRCSSPLVPSVTVLSQHVSDSRACTLYSVGYQTYFRTQYKSEMINDLPENFEWFSLLYYCFDNDNLNAIYAREAVAYQDIIPDEDKSIITVDVYRRTDNINYDMETFYSLENQEKVLSTIFPKTYTKYFKTLTNVYLEKQELIDQKNHMLPAWKIGTLYYMNVAPMYKSIKEGSWKRQGEFIRSKFKEDLTLLIFNGTHETLHLEGKPIHLNPSKPNSLRVPEIFFKIVSIKLFTEIRTMVIITHNNPFVKPKKKICDEPVDCEKYGWNVSSTNLVDGYTYCCEPTQQLEEILNYQDFSFFTGSILNLNSMPELLDIETKAFLDAAIQNRIN